MTQASATANFAVPNEDGFGTSDANALWAFAALSAAEYGFPDVSPDQPSWYGIAEALWNAETRRWGTETCEGGLYQLFDSDFDAPDDLKGAVDFVILSARLYALTRNETYADWTNTAWDWMDRVGLVVANGTRNGSLTIYNSILEPPRNIQACSENIAPTICTNRAAMMLNTAAIMFNITRDEKRENRAYGISDGTEVSAASKV